MAPVNEFAYVVAGEFVVVTRGADGTVARQVVRWGEVEYARTGTVKPARVLVVLLKES